jgi:glutamate synthase (ferredoxin)
VTTQKEKLRKKFNAVPEDMYNFFYYAAEEARNTLAHMGYKSMSDVVGRADLLQQRQNPDLVAKTPNVDLQFVRQIPVLKTAEERAALVELEKPHTQMDTLDDELLAREDVQRAINNHEHVTVESPINNLDRCATARVTGTVAKLHGNRNWRGSLHFIFTGCAGQSFGFACLPGMDFEVRGDANDYVGKSMHGGRIRIRPVDCTEGRSIGFDASKSIIVGNTCLYGATGGRFFAGGGRGALRGAQLQREGRGRGRRGPLLRVYDRRRRGGARTHRAQRGRGADRRLGLLPRGRGGVQPQRPHQRRRERAARERCWRRAAALDDRGARGGYRLEARPQDP